MVSRDFPPTWLPFCTGGRRFSLPAILNPLLAIFQAFDEKICRKPVHRSCDGSDKEEKRGNEEDRLYLLNEQEVCKE